MDKKLLYKIAYRKLDGLTPTKYDCGILCGGKCCSGGDESGIQLFPGEACMFDQGTPFLKIDKLKIDKMALGGHTVDFAVCRGTCPRKLRPLACRIYPLVPYLDEGGRLSVVPDPRASYICPLLILNKEYPMSLLFKRRVYEVFRLLIQDEDIRTYLAMLSDTLRDYSVFTGKK